MWLLRCLYINAKMLQWGHSFEQNILASLTILSFSSCSPHAMTITELISPTERCSSPERTRKRCSNMEYIIRPIPNDGSITEGTYSSTRNTMSHIYTYTITIMQTFTDMLPNVRYILQWATNVQMLRSSYVYML